VELFVQAKSSPPEAKPTLEAKKTNLKEEKQPTLEAKKEILKKQNPAGGEKRKALEKPTPIAEHAKLKKQAYLKQTH
jgi:hypothetical protein